MLKRTKNRPLLILTLALLTLFRGSVSAQPDLAGASAVADRLARLNQAGSVLMIAAHPDDENNPLVAYLARGRKLRTGYLALTRGEGGQNLIGPETGPYLGLVRTQELLEARQIDGAQQFFSRAIDFGFSKRADEALDKWGREAILSDIVWVIRRFRPDAIILRFSGTPRDGHGQHQASAILAREAFAAAADPKRFPEQLQYVKPWQVKRVLWNVFARTPEQRKEAESLPGTVRVDIGAFDPVLGYSYVEIGAQSRSQHRSQGQGTAESKGSRVEILSTVAGDKAEKDFLDGIDTTWSRYPQGAEIGRLLAEAQKAFVPEHPEAIVPTLLKARPLVAASVPERLSELDEAIALCAGIWADVSADRNMVVRGSTVKLKSTVIIRSPIPAKLGGTSLVTNKSTERTEDWLVPADHPYTEKYWLEKPSNGFVYKVTRPQLIGDPDSPPVLSRDFSIELGGQTIVLHRPVIQRYVDRGRGELTRPVVVVPRVSVSFGEQALLFPDSSSKNIEVTLTAAAPAVKGEVLLRMPAGWKSEPASHSFSLQQAGEQSSVTFRLTPPAREDHQQVRAVALVNGEEISSGNVTIAYPHFPQQNTFPPAEVSLVRTDIKSLSKNIGYVMGAGDEVPQALSKLGWSVTMLDSAALAHGDLSHYDAIVTGICAFNLRPDLRANVSRLRDYMQQGGTMVAQYNGVGGSPCTTTEEHLRNVGPYPMKFTDARVTDENAPVTFPDPKSPLLHQPNDITEKDFTGWIQERGLKFAVDWDKHYEPLFDMHDPGEQSLKGSTLVTKYGKGAYVFTALAFFRELPAGVPGAYRIFANLLSAGKTLP